MNFIYPKIICAIDDVYFRINRKKLVSGFDLPKEFTVTYHAGAMHTSANSIYSVKAAVDAEAQIVEFDVSFRPDGTPVIIHNPEPSSAQGVLLKDALAVVAEHRSCRINLDIKSTKNLAAVDALVNQYGLTERVFYTGVFEDWVDTVRTASSIPYYLNYNIKSEETSDNDLLQAVADKVKNYGAIGINSNFENATKGFVDFMHKNGLLVSLWTVNNPKDIPRVLEMQPDNITTKRPQLLKLVAYHQK